MSKYPSRNYTNTSVVVAFVVRLISKLTIKFIGLKVLSEVTHYAILCLERNIHSATLAHFKTIKLVIDEVFVQVIYRTDFDFLKMMQLKHKTSLTQQIIPLLLTWLNGLKKLLIPSKFVQKIPLNSFRIIRILCII